MTRTMRYVAAFVLVWSMLQAMYAIGKSMQYKSLVDDFIAEIETRIALDLPKLRLANPRLQTVTHEGAISFYISSINEQLTRMEAPVRILSIQDVGSGTHASGDIVSRELATTDQAIQIEMTLLSVPIVSYLSALAPLVAGAFIVLGYRPLVNAARQRVREQREVPPKPVAKLRINLHSKSISNSIDERDVALSNKPFCFYAALVDYCLQNEAPCLNHSQNVPEEIIHLANKYFYRLIELGHTKRKRPDFSTNLDKTLSEIRSALDEAFPDHSEIKDIIYPPKAQGEGSRSKMHNYALADIQPEHVEFIGR